MTQVFKKYSPGNILLSILLENYRAKKFNTFDFTIETNYTKKKLNNFIDQTYEYVSFNSFFGIFYYFKVLIKMNIKKLLLNKKKN